MKHMKKSMFITTVFMVVLLIVAVSTATFAWYTSSNTVNTVATQVNSANSSGANISIGWADTTAVGINELEFVTNEADFNPMVPTVTEGNGFTFTNTTPFYTANISYGALSGQGTIVPYIGKQAGTGSSTFFVVNYSRKATNINFSANVTGENAARLRVAVFNAATGALVYTNKDIYWGLLMDADPAVYTLTTSQPAGWVDNYTKYSTVEGTFTAPKPIAPTFQTNTYYDHAGSVLLATKPADWDDNSGPDGKGNYAYYSSTQNGVYTPVVGVAPLWAADTFYSYVEALPVRLSAPASQTFTAVDVATTIALSDGVTGTPQSFIVKAWFDGPTQVDAFGGQDATFALTATATVIP